VKALILCAGQGIRLLPHTEWVPKCLVRVAGVPILEYQIRAVRERVDEIVLITGYHGEQVQAFTDGSCTIIDNPDYATTNSIYSLGLAADRLAGTPFVLFNGDLVVDQALTDQLLTADAPTASLVDDAAELEDGEMNIVVRDGRIAEFSKEVNADRAHALSLQITKFGADDSTLLFNRVAELLASGDTGHFPAYAYDVILHGSSMIPVLRRGGTWFEIDTLDDLARADQALRTADAPATAQNLARAGRDEVQG
jgi:choline kinase